MTDNDLASKLKNLSITPGSSKSAAEKSTRSSTKSYDKEALKRRFVLLGRNPEQSKIN